MLINHVAMIMSARITRTTKGEALIDTLNIPIYIQIIK